MQWAKACYVFKSSFCSHAPIPFTVLVQNMEMANLSDQFISMTEKSWNSDWEPIC